MAKDIPFDKSEVLRALYAELPVVEVTEECETKKFKKDGEDRSFIEQVGYLLKRDRYGRDTPATIMIPTLRDGSLYAPGLYVIRGGSFKPNQYGSLELVQYGLSLFLLPKEFLDQCGVVDPYCGSSATASAGAASDSPSFGGKSGLFS